MYSVFCRADAKSLNARQPLHHPFRQYYIFYLLLVTLLQLLLFFFNHVVCLVGSLSYLQPPFTSLNSISLFSIPSHFESCHQLFHPVSILLLHLQTFSSCLHLSSLLHIYSLSHCLSHLYSFRRCIPRGYLSSSPLLSSFLLRLLFLYYLPTPVKPLYAPLTPINSDIPHQRVSCVSFSLTFLLLPLLVHLSICLHRICPSVSVFHAVHFE